MRPFALLFCSLLILLSACKDPSSAKNTRPSITATNEPALTNLNLAIEYMRRGNYETALAKLNRAHRADPGYYATHNVYGLLYQQLREKEKAERHFKKALSLNSNDSQTMNNYGRFLCQQGRYDEAESTFKQAADNPLYDTPEIPITNAGMCLGLAGDLAKAETYYRRALTINPKIASALIQMAELTFNRDNYMSSRAYLQRYTEVSAHTPKSLWLGIQVERVLGDRDAVSSYSLLLRNNFPDSEEASLLKQSGDR